MREPVLKLEDLTGLCYRRFDQNVKVVVRRGDIHEDYFPFDPFKIDTEHISEIIIERPVRYSSTPDGKMVFYRMQTTKNEKILLTYLGKDEDVVIPDSVCEIGSSSFFDRKIRSIAIPNSVYEIGAWAFGMNSPEEIDLPASVKFVWQGSLITTSIIHVHGRVEGLMLTAVNAYQHNNRTANFCVEYEGRWHIFPNLMNSRYKDKAEASITDRKYKKGIHNHFHFANTVEEKLRCAVEIYGVRKDIETERYLKSNIHVLCDLAIEKGEEKFVKFLNMFAEYDMLQPKMIENLLGSIDEDWIQARACLMNLLHENAEIARTSFDI